MNTKTTNFILGGITFAAIAAMFFINPIPQDLLYHNFADQRTLLGINHFWNVMSNLPFVFVGIYGLWRVNKLNVADIKLGYLVLCLGVVLVCFGSSYYHYNPNNQTLVWDRLPMTIAFMALFSLILHERVLRVKKLITLWPLIVVGIASVFYWDWTEQQTKGDLRFYALVQFLPVMLIPIILWLYPKVYMRSAYLLWAFVFYLLAKVTEHFDAQIYSTLGEMSGHAIKHVSAAIAVWFIIESIPVNKV